MSEKRLHILSFIGGIVFLSVLTGILLNKSSVIREEVEKQVQGILSTSKDVLYQVQVVVTKVGAITEEIKGSNENGTMDSEPVAFLSDGYDELWRLVETQNKTYVKNHPS
jgi:hypothetical protein